MKQIIVLEAHEIARLQKGKTLVIGTAAGELGLQFMAAEELAANGKPKALRCDICGATEGLKAPFSSQASVSAHKRMAHRKGKS